MQVYAGIDYSMSSPALCVGKEGQNMEQCKFFAFTSKNKEGPYGNITCYEYPVWESDEERFDNLSSYFLDILIDYGVDFLWIEGYAYGAKGRVFEIGENTGLLKHKLWKEGFQFGVISPNYIKRFATGKGNANKEQMYRAWVDQGGRDINWEISPKQKKIVGPAGDIVDSYFVMQCGLSLY